MKKTVFAILALCFATLASAQVSEGVNWYNGTICYSAHNIAGGRVVMNAMAEGEELEFVLVPLAGKPGTYQVADSSEDYVNAYADVATVRHLTEGSLDVLCFYSASGRLEAVMSNEGDEWDSQKLNCERWLGEIGGEYYYQEVEGLTRVGLGSRQAADGTVAMTVDGTPTSFEILTFNGMITEIIRVAAGTHMEGLWKVEQDREGLKLRAVEEDPDAFFAEWKMPGMSYSLAKWDDGTGVHRFDYTQDQLLFPGRLLEMDKEALRVMRNYILARHGYKFSSMDLQIYFSIESWYKPRASNDGISNELSLLERLNIELIQAAEARLRER